jgi:UDP-glucose 4-epimerase
MRIVVTGATGNVGTSVVAALSRDPSVGSVVALARRRPIGSLPDGVSFVCGDVTSTDLEPIFRGADTLIHLAWLIQPGRDEATTRGVNVDGSSRVFDAAARAGVRSLVYASSVGAYSPGPKARRVDESWPTGGVLSSFYSRHKAEVERLLDVLEREHPGLRVVRLRPGLIFKRDAASEIRRLFIGPFVPRWAFQGRLVPVVPDVPGLVFQAVHGEDVGEAYRLATVSDVRGAFNIASEPVIDLQRCANILNARPIRTSAAVLRGAAAAAYALRLTPTEPGWLDMALAVPTMSTERAVTELGFVARRSGEDALRDLFTGLRHGMGGDTPPLARHAGGPMRLKEILTGLGSRQ